MVQSAFSIGPHNTILYNTIQWLCAYYIIDNGKLDSSNKVSIHKYCHAPKMVNDTEEAVQLIYLSKGIMSRIKIDISVLLL